MGQNAISAIDQLPPSLDAAFLREEARRRVEQLAKLRWTDYNTHDPGINILEVLAYALTDLGLRARLDIPDLIAEGEAKPFFTAREILPSAAFTPADYRRRLLDLPTIKNAWISSLAGIHSLLLDLEVKGSSLALNETWLREEVLITEEKSYEYYVVFPHWDSPEAIEWSSAQALTSVSIKSILDADSDQELINSFSVKVTLAFGAVTNLERRFWIRLPIGIAEADLSDFTNKVKSSLSNLAFWEQHRIRGVARKKLLDNIITPFIRQQRNLCEDWGKISTIKLQQIGVSAAVVELQPEAKPEVVLANICVALHQLIDPPVPRSTFEEGIKKGKTPAEIWEGPAPQNGHISDAALRQSPRQDLIYTSDIVRVIMEQPGVVGVSGLAIDHFMDRVKVASKVRNCLRLRNTSEYKPKFSFFDTHLTVFKRGIRIALDLDSVQQLYEQWINPENTKLPNTSSDDLIPPKGEKGLDLNTFYSVQNEFPAVYGLREGEMLHSTPPSRQAQVKQFKAYLLFFEQIMANAAAQIAHLQDLFSISKEVGQTYFFQPLYNVPGIAALLKDFPGGNTTWDAFTQTQNAYSKNLEKIVEDESVFLRRRNQFLNHLLARVGEHFGDYEAWSLAQNGGEVSADLVYDKLDFLHNYPHLSANRASAFNDLGPAWNSDNVSGYEKRVAALLGIPNYKRRALSRIFNIQEHVEIFSQTGSPGAEEANFRINTAASTDPSPLSKQIIVSSKSKHPVKEIASFIQSRLAEAASKASNYKFKPASASAGITFEIQDQNGATLATRHTYASSRAAAFASIRDALHLFQGRLIEGMHVVEHAILRPIVGSFSELEPVIIPGTGIEPFVSDPYPHQLSIFLPAWAPRFQQPAFQALVERVLRNELPVHVLPYIYWVNLDSDQQIPLAFIHFENAWRAWLEQRDANRLDTLVDAINLLRTSPFVRLSPQYRTFDEQVSL